MAEARGFVAWMYNPHGKFGPDCSKVDLYVEDEGDGQEPVYVTPLREGEPKPGETWEDVDGNRVEVWSTPFPSTSGAVTRNKLAPIVQTDHGIRRVADLRPIPVEKTYRLDLSEHTHLDFGTHIRAESKEAALAKLADALEEVVEPLAARSTREEDDRG